MTLSSLTPVNWLMDRTRPSSASMEMFASISRTQPNPMTAVPTITRIQRPRSPVTSQSPSIHTMMSTNRLNSIENGSWLSVRTILPRSRRSAHSTRMNSVYTMKIIVPIERPAAWLSTVGSDTIGDAPIPAFTVRTTPRDSTKTETTISTMSFLNVGLAVSGMLLSGFPI